MTTADKIEDSVFAEQRGAERRWRLWRRWAAATTMGHIGGALFWAIPARWLWSGPGEGAGPASMVAMFGLTIAAALAQGAVLGMAQGLVLRTTGSIQPWTWAAATALGVAGGWLLIVIGAPRVDAVANETAALVGAIALGGTLFGMIVGGCQAFVFGQAGVRSRGWIAANGAAWGIGLLLTVAVLQTLGGGQIPVLVVALVAATVAGLSLGLITATQLLRSFRAKY